MSWETALAIYAGALFVLLATGVHIGVALGLTGLIGISLSSGTNLWRSLGDVLWNTTNSFTLTAIPLFVLMGEIIVKTGISRRFYGGIARVLAPFPGGLAHANILGCATFSAISGSSVATALTMGTVAIPELRARGYDPALTAGSLAAGGTLGILIPPSIPMIIYAAMVNESVISLFIAGIVPGIVLSLLFMIFIFLRVAISPRLAPADRTTRLTTGTVLHELSQCWAVLVLIAAIIGGMYFGIVTPTEAAAFGCAAALVIGLAYRDLSWDDCGRALLAAVVTTCSVVFIIVMGSILSFAVVDAGISRGVTKLLTQSQLGRFEFFLFLFLLYLVLGMFLDGIAMMLLTIPILYPAVIAFGFDGIWFGVILVVVIELGALTPPMGLNLFAIHSVSGGQPLAEIIRGSAPFAAIISGFCFLLYAFPQIALILPRSLK